MNVAVRRFITSIPILKTLYYKMRAVYNRERAVRAAQNVFQNIEDFRRAITEKHPGTYLDLYMHDGLRFKVRQNVKDAAILTEVFLDAEYARGFELPENPIIIDIGGYIGDFAIYAAKYLKAKKVVTIEPSAQNFILLEANIRDNNYQDCIIALNKAVTDGKPAKLNVDTAEDGQERVSAYYGCSHGELKEVPGISLAQIMKDYNFSSIDLLKIDCEGGEYMILLTAPAEVLHATRNIIFEYHEIQNFAVMLVEVKKRLVAEGFTLKTCGRGKNLISATR